MRLGGDPFWGLGRDLVGLVKERHRAGPVRIRGSMHSRMSPTNDAVDVYAWAGAYDCRWHALPVEAFVEFTATMTLHRRDLLSGRSVTSRAADLMQEALAPIEDIVNGRFEWWTGEICPLTGAWVG